jgi:hypothetical protein
MIATLHVLVAQPVLEPGRLTQQSQRTTHGTPRVLKPLEDDSICAMQSSGPGRRSVRQHVYAEGSPRILGNPGTELQPLASSPPSG